MFLSTENPPHDHPLSSPSSYNLFNTCSNELGQSHLSTFSIRDYTYSNRKKNIKNNWPFSHKSLNLLSAHGVSDPLPPFQKFSTLTNQFETTAHQNIAETSKGVCSQSRVIKNGLFTSISKSKVEAVVLAANKSRKCGRGGGGMVKSKEDGLVMAASESIMASKICPICKTFSSASNTTLNAHIDQCLSVDSAVVSPVSSKPSKPRVNSVDSAMPTVSTKPSKPRVSSVDSAVPPASSKPRGKPRMKVKTMVDIYASAKECTLEDLDKRNGTQWASVLSCTNRVAADKSHVSKKRKASPVGVGPVYIDAKGQKLRILTEFSEKKTTTTSREQQEEGSSEKKSSSQGSKENSKRLRGKKPCKYIKLTSHKANAIEVPGEGSSSKGHRRIYNQRMLAKKKLNALRDQPSEDDDDDDDDSWSGEERLVLRGSSPLNKQKLRSKVTGKSKKSLGGAYLNTVHLKKNVASIQEDEYPSGKNVKEASPRATSMRNLSPPIVANGWRRLSPHVVELKRARFGLSEEEEETGRWESEMTQEVEELSDDDDYVSGDNGEIKEVLWRSSSPSFSAYDDEETSEEEEEEDNTIKRDTVLLDTPPSNEIIPSEERAAMYYSEDVIYGQPANDEYVRFGSEVKGKGSLYVEVDTIPIPGPPGSFLPSPRGMGFDEHLGNSSVITSQFQSSMDRNSSESPVSAVSNFPAGRLQEPDIPLSYSTTPLTFCVPSHHGIIPEAEPMTVDKTTPLRLGNNGHESCCCQRKERISEGIALNHQASHLLQRRAASSSIAVGPNHPFEQSPYMIQQDLDLHSKVSNRAVVVPPSPSNSVLRLMGKDLMVMNQEEASPGSLKPAPQFHDPQLCAGTGLYFNTGLYLRNSFKPTHQLQKQTQAQASPFRDNFDHVRYFSPPS